MLRAPANVLVARNLGVVAFGQIVIIEATAISIIAGVDLRTDPLADPPRPRVPKAAMPIDIRPVPVERGLALSGKVAAVEQADQRQVRGWLDGGKYRADAGRACR